MKRLKAFFNWQFQLSTKFDQAFLDSSYTTYGTMAFHASLISAFIKPDSLIYDIGGGKFPHIFPGLKAERRLRSIGFDIDPGELARAPKGLRKNDLRRYHQSTRAGAQNR